MINVKRNVNYTIVCKCGEKIIVEKFEDAQKQGWRIDSNCFPINEKSISKVFCPKCVEKENERLFNSEDIYERIRGGYYTKFPERFRNDALEYVGLSNNPKADKIYSKAYDRGHSSGCHEVLNELQDLAELFD